MKKLGLLIGLALLGVVAYFLLYSKKSKPRHDEVKTAPVAVSKYSAVFNTSVNESLTDYYALSEAFVNWDTAAISQHTTALQQKVDALKFSEVKKDTAIYETAVSYAGTLNTELETIKNQTDITLKRRSFHTFSQNYYDLLRTIQYDGGTVFLQECPMAFNDDESGLWLSAKPEIRNPYLGTSHPKYRSGMLECGETKDSLHFKK